MDEEVAILAERVAAAADAWLRDPQDAGVYRRLVEAVLAWRKVTRTQLDIVNPAPNATSSDPPAGEPHPIRGTLGDVIEELRRRGADQAPAPQGSNRRAESAPPHADPA